MRAVTASATTTPSATPSATPSPTDTPTATPSLPPSQTPTDAPPPTLSATPTQTATGSATATATGTLTVTPTSTPGQAALQIRKTLQTTVAPGAVLVYTIAYGNVGSGPAIGVVITETVPDNTRFDAADSSPGWSCADGSPPGITCTHAVGSLPAGEQGTLSYAVVVDSVPSSRVIRNAVQIADAEGGSSSGSSSTYIPAAGPPSMAGDLSTALALLAGIAGRHLRRRS